MALEQSRRSPLGSWFVGIAVLGLVAGACSDSTPQVTTTTTALATPSVTPPPTSIPTAAPPRTTPPPETTDTPAITESPGLSYEQVLVLGRDDGIQFSAPNHLAPPLRQRR